MSKKFFKILFSKSSTFLEPSGNVPRVSYFKTVYTKYSSYSHIIHEEYIDTSTHLGSKKSTPIKHYIGHLLDSVMLKVDLPKIELKEDIDDPIEPTGFGWVNNIGHKLIKKIGIYVDGNELQSLEGHVLDTLSLKRVPFQKKKYYDQLVGKIPDDEVFDETTFGDPFTLFIEIPFFFTRESRLSLPIVLCQKSNIEFKVEFNEFDFLWTTNNEGAIPKQPRINSSYILHYTILQSNVIAYLASKNIKMIIEKTELKTLNYQNNISYKNINIDDINYPCKELLIKFTGEDIDEFYEYRDVLKTMKLRVDNVDLVPELPSLYYKIVSKYYYNKNIPDEPIYSISFSKCPDAYYPNGHIIFPKNATTLKIKFNKNHNTYGLIQLIYIIYDVCKITNGRLYYI